MEIYVVLAALLAMLALSFAIAPVAQLGEFGGHLFFNVTPGGTQTMQFGIFNSDPNNTIGYSLSYIIIYKVANQTIYPNVTAYPKGGLLLPNQNAVINVTVRVPGNARPGMSWGGNVQFVQQAAPGGSGAFVRTGVVKIFNVVVAQPPFNLLNYVVPGAIAVGIGIGAVYYFKVSRKRVPAKRAAVRAPRKKPAPRRRRRRRAAARARVRPKRTAREAPRKRATRRRRR